MDYNGGGDGNFGGLVLVVFFGSGGSRGGEHIVGHEKERMARRENHYHLQKTKNVNFSIYHMRIHKRQ